MKTTTAQFVVTVKRVNKLLKSALISDVNDKAWSDYTKTGVDYHSHDCSIKPN